MPVPHGAAAHLFMELPAGLAGQMGICPHHPTARPRDNAILLSSLG